MNIISDYLFGFIGFIVFCFLLFSCDKTVKETKYAYTVYQFSGGSQIEEFHPDDVVQEGPVYILYIGDTVVMLTGDVAVYKIPVTNKK
jgi:hypothetical protein